MKYLVFFTVIGDVCELRHVLLENEDAVKQWKQTNSDSHDGEAWDACVLPVPDDFDEKTIARWNWLEGRKGKRHEHD